LEGRGERSRYSTTEIEWTGRIGKREA